MPRVHTTAIWNGKRGEACVFVYRKKNMCSLITWRGTWDLKLRLSMIEVWGRVATRITRYKIRIGETTTVLTVVMQLVPMVMLFIS